METKKIEKTLVAVHSLKTSLSKINEIAVVVPNQLMEELSGQNIEPVAPQIWHYLDCDGKMDSEFTLEVCVPVDKKGASTDFISFKELNDFQCVSHIHEGSWDELMKAYDKLFEDIEKAKIVHTGVVREVYHHCDMEDQSKCVTEIQVEMQ